MVRVWAGIADCYVTHLGQVLDGLFQTLDGFLVLFIYVELVDEFVYRANDLHVLKLTVTLQELKLSLL